MANHLHWFTLDPLRGTVIGFGSVDPTAGNGLDKAPASLYVKTDGTTATLYLKSGVAATAWTTVAVGALTQAQADALYLKLAGGTLTGDVTMSGGKALTVKDAAGKVIAIIAGSNANGNLELGDSTRAAGTPFIDFHYGTGAAQDYNVRIINDADGVLHVQFATGAKQLNVDGAMKQSSVDVAKVIISTSAPSGTPASGVGTLWVQY